MNQFNNYQSLSMFLTCDEMTSIALCHFLPYTIFNAILMRHRYWARYLELETLEIRTGSNKFTRLSLTF